MKRASGDNDREAKRECRRAKRDAKRLNKLAKKQEVLGFVEREAPSIAEVPSTATKPSGAVGSKKEKGAMVGAPTESREKGVRIKDLREGKGAVLVEKKGVRVRYAGKLADGTTFDEGVFTFKLGSTNVIEGWNIGLRGARVGGRRKVLVPPQAGYGIEKYQDIPPNSTLVFTCSILEYTPERQGSGEPQKTTRAVTQGQSESDDEECPVLVPVASSSSSTK
mmetsp:Transcript_16009/g.31960  ORF Transcript_16009/g.31960 Transcript_16009/m.31960 type:complete len:222 (+) Transcript_16009:11-676(+)